MGSSLEIICRENRWIPAANGRRCPPFLKAVGRTAVLEHLTREHGKGFANLTCPANVNINADLLAKFISLKTKADPIHPHSGELPARSLVFAASVHRSSCYGLLEFAVFLWSHCFSEAARTKIQSKYCHSRDTAPWIANSSNARYMSLRP